MSGVRQIEVHNIGADDALIAMAAADNAICFGVLERSKATGR
jgi:hypothetical protein